MGCHLGAGALVTYLRPTQRCQYLLRSQVALLVLKANAPDGLPTPLLLLHPNVEYKITTRVVIYNATPIPAAHDVLVFVSGSIGVLVEYWYLI